MNTSDEKPWLLEFSYKFEPRQIDQEERDVLMAALQENKEGATLKDGSYISLRNAHIVANEHYVSPESIALGRKHQEWIDEYQFLKREGQLVTQQEYVEWKKKSVAQIKALNKYLKEPVETENEKKRTT